VKKPKNKLIGESAEVRHIIPNETQSNQELKSYLAVREMYCFWETAEFITRLQ
jgi:hypothetical protein